VTTTFDTPGPILSRLAELENDLAERQNRWEKAAGDRARLIRDWEHRLASHRVSAKGNDAEARKAAALGAAIDQDDLYERLKEAEGSYEALKSVIRVIEVRVGIGQSILKSMGRS
jgi:hypothetical protein